ncbi:aminotransferase [Paenibacillus sp. N3.4]|nr:aminotransferase [Paenibacillus sp. N3.4]
MGGNTFGGFGQGGFPAPFEGGGGFFGGGNPAGGGFFGGGSPAPAPAPATSSGGGNFLSNLLGGGGGTTSGSSSNPLSGLSLKQISGFVDRMGGIDGIIGSMGKVQKFMTSFQQMAPMMKTLIGSFGKGKVNSSDGLRRNRKRRKKSSSRRNGKASIKSRLTKGQRR